MTFAATQPITSAMVGRADAPPTARQVLIVLLASGAIGFFFGAMEPTWQDALEPAQVLAGRVTYPLHTPVYIYSVKTWTVVHQPLALALRWGCSERTLALALSGVLGMLSLQALGLFVLALGGSVAWAVLSSFFLYFVHATPGGVTYPVMLMGAPFTYGIVGLSYMLLAIALLGTGQVRAGALCLGFGLAVHFTLGLLCLAATGIAVAADPQWGRRMLGIARPYFLAGLVAAAASAAIHFLSSDVDLRQTAAGLGTSASFTHYWGQAHRRPFALLGVSMTLVWANLGLSALWLGPFRDDLPDRARLMLKILVASAVLALALSISYWLPPAVVPNALYALMPARLLNLHVLTSMALVVGLAWRYQDNVWVQAILAALVVFTLADSLHNGAPSIGGRLAFGIAGSALIVLAGLRRLGLDTTVARPQASRFSRRVTVLAPAVALPFAALIATQQFYPLHDDSNDLMYGTMAGRPGLLLTGADIHGIQLRTRRPVLLDGGALDGLPYIPEAVPQTDIILRRVYGIDTLRDVPVGDIGGLWDDAGKALWEARTAAEWREIRHEFGVTDVLTYSGWRLHLPVITRSADYTLYSIQ